MRRVHLYSLAQRRTGLLAQRRAGFTLIEMLLAMALVSVLFLALVRLMDTTMTIWERTETGRELTAVSSGVLDLLERDLRALESGARGDLLAEWRMVDTDRDGVASAPYPLLRFVRQASAADLLTLDPDAAVGASSIDLIEVCWALVPSLDDEQDQRSVAVLMRGARRLGDEETLSFLDEDFLDSRGGPILSALDVVSGGVLWVNTQFAAQTSVLHGGWVAGDGLKGVARCWDAWDRDRPDDSLTDWNRVHSGSPPVDDQPILPRRIRLELEIERPSETLRRPSLDQPVEKDDLRLELDDDRRLPGVGAHVLLEEEWVLVTAQRGGTLTVKRGARGTRPTPHPSGTKMHFGKLRIRELPVALYREEWDL